MSSQLTGVGTDEGASGEFGANEWLVDELIATHPETWRIELLQREHVPISDETIDLLTTRLPRAQAIAV